MQFLGSLFKGKAIFDVYLYNEDYLINYNFSLQTEEVESVHWLSIAEINELMEKGLVRASSCEHFKKFISPQKDIQL